MEQFVRINFSTVRRRECDLGPDRALGTRTEIAENRIIVSVAILTIIFAPPRLVNHGFRDCG